MSEIGKKLQLKPGQKVLVLNAPEWFATQLALEGYTFTNASETPSVGTYDAVQLFVRNTEELEKYVPEVIPLLNPKAIFWIAYPKKSSGIKSDLSRDQGWSTVAGLGYEGVRQIAIDDTWSSLRFKHKSDRNENSMFGVDMPGIDRKTKTVIPPDDMQRALEEAGLVEVFSKLPFTHRKEYVVAVLEAKRPETRSKRIQKAVDQLMEKSRM